MDGIETKFRYIDDTEISEYERVQVETAYQLKRIADSLEQLTKMAEEFDRKAQTGSYRK